MRIVVLGCGFHGRGVAYQLAGSGQVDELLVVDKDPSRALATASKAGARWVELDIEEGGELRTLLEGATVVFNAVGPYHLHGLKVIDAAIDAGVHYVDMNDDHEVTEAIFLDPTWDLRARESGTTILSGCGIMPGLSGILARYGCDQLDRPERVSIWFVWNYSLAYPTAIHHFLRINSGLGPQYIDGDTVKPEPFTGRERVDFLPPVGPKEVYYTGVPDPVSISRSLGGLTEVTAKGGFHQPEANDLMEAMVRWGFTSYEVVSNSALSPMEFFMAYLTSKEGKEYLDIAPLELPMSVRVQVEGLKGQVRRRFTYEIQDYSRRGTTAVAALATLMVANGQIKNRGVGSPEGWIPAGPFLRHILQEPGIKIFSIEEGEEPTPLKL